MSDVLVLIGTSKGLFLARGDERRTSWTLDGPHFPMNAIYAAAIDTRPGVPRLLVGADSEHWGPSVATSDDLGASWEQPDHAPVAFPERTGVALRRVWQLQPGTQPDVVWAGTEPSALFRSEDGGRTYALVDGLWDHPHRTSWAPGGGGQAVHTVLPDPRDPQRLVVAMSTGGVYVTADGGASWRASNTGVRAYFFPNPWPEFGQCVHKVARDAADPDRLYLQNHDNDTGVLRSDDGGATWTAISEGLPTSFGFAVAAHPRRGDTAYVVPLVADADRRPADSRLRVFRTDDAGASWQALSDGLPTEPHFGVVLRDALCTDGGDPAGVYLGTRTGEVWAGRDDGATWTCVAAHLPDVLCVRAAVL